MEAVVRATPPSRAYYALQHVCELGLFTIRHRACWPTLGCSLHAILPAGPPPQRGLTAAQDALLALRHVCESVQMEVRKLESLGSMVHYDRLLVSGPRTSCTAAHRADGAGKIWRV